MKCQEQEASYDNQDKDDVIDVERWNWDEDWLPKIRTHSGCTLAEIIGKLQNEFEKLDEEYEYFGSETSCQPMQAEDAGPAHSTGDTTVSFPGPAPFDQSNEMALFGDNSGWDYASNQMHLDYHSTRMFPSSDPYPMQTGSARQAVPSLPAGPSLFTEATPAPPSIDPRLLNGNSSQNALVSLTSPSAYGGHYQSNQFVQSSNMNPVSSSRSV